MKCEAWHDAIFSPVVFAKESRETEREESVGREGVPGSQNSSDAICTSYVCIGVKRKESAGRVPFLEVKILLIPISLESEITVIAPLCFARIVAVSAG